MVEQLPRPTKASSGLDHESLSDCDPIDVRSANRCEFMPCRPQLIDPSLPSARFTRRLFVQLNPSRDRGLDRGASCRFGLLCEHHQLVTWLNVRTLFAARSKRCSSTTCIIELVSAAQLISLKRG